ncbi:MAG: DUF6600 domain-containing protein [Thermoanaerobaculia bacterium]
MKHRLFQSAAFAILALGLAALPARAQRNGYSHVTALEGSASVISQANGEVPAKVNLPLSAGDEVVTDAGGRVEIELADGNRFQIAGESKVRLDAVAGQEGSSASESSINVPDGSLAAESLTGGDSALRIDTPDASIYLPAQSQARINVENARGTSVIARRGSAEVQTRAGSTTVEQGSYLMVHGGEQPEVDRGSFSRDRFDIWVAERTDSTLAAYNSASARYVEGSDYDEDVAVLDDYGQWDYSPTYQTEVWRPTVGADWSPYSSGYWYDTPIGASWVSYEPWGWFPHHYGNWFFDAAFNSWCWSPAYLYSPAWVYWGYTPSYVGWCPIGYYSHFGSYAGYWGSSWRRSGLYISLNGVFDPSRIDLGRGWRFLDNERFGRPFDRRAILSGRSMAGRLGTSLAVTSRPAVVPISGRAGTGPALLRSYARSAPQAISRQSTSLRSAELTPYLARQRSLPQATVRALTQENIARVDSSGRALTGPGAGRLPAAAASRQDLARTRQSSPRSEAWRAPQAETRALGPSRAGGAHFPSRNFEARSDWRQRPSSRAESAAPRAFDSRGPRTESRSFSGAPSNDSWRSRYNAPPAQRVIEGIDRGRRIESAPRSFESQPRRFEAAPPRGEGAPRRYETPQRYEAPQRFEAPQRYEAPRQYEAPQRYAGPQPRSAAPAPRMEQRSAPPPRSQERSAPPRREDRPHH